jgi:hypothetical protein
MMQNEDCFLGFVHTSPDSCVPPPFIKILNWHEVVNNRVGGKPVFISFCPLCVAGMVFDAHMKTVN